LDAALHGLFVVPRTPKGFGEPFSLLLKVPLTCDFLHGLRKTSIRTEFNTNTTKPPTHPAKPIQA
jgi:hypothetical protein